MQYIELILEDEDGKKIESANINFAEVIKVLPGDSKGSFPWLYGIDPYGLTTFNQYQIPHVKSELSILLPDVKEKESRLAIENSLKFLEKISQHTYIKLIGD